MVKNPIVETLGRRRGTPLEPFGSCRRVSVEPDYDEKLADGCGGGWAI